MLNPHHLGYKSKRTVGWALSGFAHLGGILAVLGYVNYSLFPDMQQVSMENFPSIIEITLVPDFIATKENETKLESKIKPDTPDIIEQNLDEKTISIPQPAVDNVVKAEITKSPAPERYEQILARHFINAIPGNLKQIKQDSVVDIWIRINRKGDIEDYGFPPELHDAQLKLMIETAIINASPVPLPPPETFTSDYAQYLLPLLLRK